MEYFTANNTYKYIDILPKLVDKYNNTYHRSIKCKPTDAIQAANYAHVFTALYAKANREKNTKPKFRVGDRVRISKKKATFEKGFTPNWTEEVFVIDSVKDTKPPTYTIKDLRGEAVQGSFYEPELQLSKQEVYRVEKVLKRRTKDGVKEVYVKWKGYGRDFNSWTATADIQKI